MLMGTDGRCLQDMGTIFDLVVVDWWRIRSSVQPLVSVHAADRAPGPTPITVLRNCAPLMSGTDGILDPWMRGYSHRC